jgi:predicted ATP-grasp superfamily ATP-dependent carboligase
MKRQPSLAPRIEGISKYLSAGYAAFRNGVIINSGIFFGRTPVNMRIFLTGPLLEHILLGWIESLSRSAYNLLGGAMASENLRLYKQPFFQNATLLLGFSGWMDGGDVSTGAIKYLAGKLDSEELGYVDPEGFYIYNVPGTMEVSALFRPHARIEGGLIKEYQPPENVFFGSSDNKTLMFLGKEPNLAWEAYADCIFEFCTRFHVETVYFIGSVAGVTPHTREPRIAFSASDNGLVDELSKLGLRPSSYEGPASLGTYLTARAPDEGVKIASLVAEIPAYVQGYNPRSVDTMVRLIARLLNLRIDLGDLDDASKEFEQKVSELVESQEELSEKVHELERDYDKEAFDREMTDLKSWLSQNGLKID